MSQVRLLETIRISAWKIFLCFEWISPRWEKAFSFMLSLSAHLSSSYLSSAAIPLIWESAPVIWNLRIELLSQYEVLKNALFHVVSVLQSILKTTRPIVKEWSAGSTWNVRKIKNLMLPPFPETHCSAVKPLNITRSRAKSFSQFHRSDSYRNQISIFGTLGVRSFDSVQSHMKCCTATKFNSHYTIKNYTWR
jgi:hypothetical protein